MLDLNKPLEFVLSGKNQSFDVKLLTTEYPTSGGKDFHCIGSYEGNNGYRAIVHFLPDTGKCPYGTSLFVRNKVERESKFFRIWASKRGKFPNLNERWFSTLERAINIDATYSRCLGILQVDYEDDVIVSTTYHQMKKDD